jgi:FkbM family methyltransferase
MSMMERLKCYYAIAGVRGVAAITAFRLCGLPKEITVRPPSLSRPMRLRVRTSDPTVYMEIMRGEYDFDLPFQPKTIIDAGANIGVASIYFANKYPDAKIVAIEAEASNFDVLARNVKPYPSITPIHAALWNRDGEIVVSEPDAVSGASENWAFVTRDGGEGTRVRAVTLPTLMEELRIPVIDVAKIDIEGAEQEMFDDVGWLNGVKCVMIELHDRLRPGCSAAVEPAMQAFERTQRGMTTFFVRKDIMAAHRRIFRTPATPDR